ncbi:MAG: insulinase family protein [Cyclobacteriaceae bacterium]|nr:insulinase family protein [Cyclobacteriaceae bacterium]
MKKILLLIISIVIWSCSPSEKNNKRTKTNKEGGYTYEYVDGDPMKTRIYKLENGLTVYLSDYDNAPRAHVYIPVKAGGKNDPANNTGLAHYLEHMMFKGNDQFGTKNYKEEKILLDSIEWMFNEYAKLTDSLERKNHYAKIDEMSGRAAQYAIPNEYDKLIAGLGGKGLNAYTTEDRTVYTVDIPSNELNKFLEIEGTRFRKIVNRLFHTELETVYEEKNRSLDSDGWKVHEAMLKQIFKKHPYGTQTVIGTIDHLKNPSITEIDNYFNENYRPNNVAICISGDIDYTETIKTIDTYFGSWEANPDLQPLPEVVEDSIMTPRAVEVFGPDAESIRMGFRFPGTSSPDYNMLQLVDMILNNSEAGLIDLNLSQKQMVLRAGSYVNAMNDYSVHTFYGYPKEGQTLEEVQELILEEIEKVKNGEFEDWLIPAVVSDLKKNQMRQLENNYSRANKMVMAFTNDMSWESYLNKMDEMEKISKEQVVEFAKKHYSNNYAIVFKRTGEDPNKQRVVKPQITKVPVNREDKSAFHERIANIESPKLNPVFIDYKEDVKRGSINGKVEVLANQNDENGLFQLNYLFDIGSNNDPSLKTAMQYLEYLGTDELKAEDFKKELYKIGCRFSVSAGNERIYVSLNGLDENLEKAVELFEKLLVNVVPDQEELDKLVLRSIKARDDSKKSKGTILFSGLMNYAEYGEKNPFSNVLTNSEMIDLKGEVLVEKLKNIMKMEHRILYYGPRDVDDLVNVLEKYHDTKEELLPLPELVDFEQASTDVPTVYWTHYDMVQTEFIAMHKGEKYDKNRTPKSRIFNEYFGGGMNSIVFQEIREAQGLAYSVFSRYSTPSKVTESDIMFAYVGTQADKQAEAMAAIRDLITNLPESQEAFNIAKQSILSKIESERITRSSILWDYERAKKRNLDYDIRKDIYEQVKEMTIDSVKSFHEEHIKNQEFVTILIGNREKINFDDLKKYGEVKELSLDEIFGFESGETVDIEVKE